ncbi:MAG: peroxidase family protein, partial [Myxococcota bacterium]
LAPACKKSSDDTQAITVSVGADIVVSEGALVEISGAVDEEGVELAWSQVSGPDVRFEQTDAAIVRFQAPAVVDDEVLVLRLTARRNRRTGFDDISVRIADRGNGPTGASPQGIDENNNERRQRARGNRDRGRRLGDREVRTYDGSNNNVDHPEWGASFAHLQRLAPSAYADGIDDMAGAARPSARVVSNALAEQAEGTSIPNPFNRTDFVWQWGQFLDHDIDLTDGVEESMPVAVPSGDPWFDPNGTGTVEIPFSRAIYDPATGLSADNPREQENEITSWIDGSMVYGSTSTRAAALRVGRNSPMLATSTGNLLPFNEDSLLNANGFVTDPTALFVAGDIRVNEQVGLAVMHTLFVREHNRRAAELRRDFPEASADEIFEAARRLVIAEIQMITYNEWLPALLGEGAIPRYRGYDSSVNPTIYNGFSAAAFRLGHSMLNERLLRVDARGAVVAEGHLDLDQAFFNAPQILTREDSLDPILRGLASQTHQALDNMIVSDVRNFLFGLPGNGGLDLASLNIQRGRDHGLPSYNTMRTAMGLSAVSSFSDITDDTTVVTALANTYNSVSDIDLWVGGLCEDAVDGSQLGPLFQAILVRQFTELRDGDRFWYQNDLSEAEMNRIRNTTLARVIRANTGVGDELQDNVFVTR